MLALLVFAPASTTFAEPTAQERQAAADAYDRGVSSFLSEDFRAAAHWFETANRLAPSPAALMQAIRANDRAGNEMRAASLALRLSDLYPDEEQAIRATQQILDEARGRYVTVTVECNEDCAIEVNGALEGHTRFFIEPNQRARVTAEFPGGRLTEEVSGTAGSNQELAFTAPPPPPPTEDVGPGAVASASGRGGIPRAVFFTSLGLTAASGGALAWSGVNTLAGVDEYESNPTPEALEAGQRRERRTNMLIGLTAGMAAATALFAIFTNWSGDKDDQGARPTVGLSQTGLVMGMEGRF